MGFAVTPQLEIIFDTVKSSRKYPNLKKNPQVAWVVGCATETTVQYEGIAQELANENELAKYKTTYFEAFPMGLHDRAGQALRISWFGRRGCAIANTIQRVGELRSKSFRLGASPRIDECVRFDGISPDACRNYSSRRATDTGCTAARMAGRRPPSTPMTRANSTPSTSRSNVILKAKATLEKV
jgi:hypothetical protein